MPHAVQASCATSTFSGRPWQDAKITDVSKNGWSKANHGGSYQAFLTQESQNGRIHDRSSQSIKYKSLGQLDWATSVGHLCMY